MDGEVLFVAGLPGSGKTTFLKRLENDGYLVFDDFKGLASDDSPRFCKSRHYPRLLQALHEKQRCAVADIDFCREESRADAEESVRSVVRHVSTIWHCFAHDIESCEANIKERNRACLENDLKKLKEYSRIYTMPPIAVRHPVLRSTGASARQKREEIARTANPVLCHS